MNHSLESSPLIPTDLTRDKMEKWVAAQGKGEKIEIDIYGKPSEKQIQELENIRSLSRELQDNLHELENTVRIADVENQAMNPTAAILDYSEDHEFVSANQLDNYYAEEDKVDAKEEEKRRLTKGKDGTTEIQQFFKGQCVFVTGGTGFLGKVLIEKLLRSCCEVDTIYVLIRDKKGKDAQSRLNDMMDEFLFHKALEVNPKGIHKVVAIPGDMELPGLGMCDEHRRTLAAKVSVIINAAATVKFDEKLSVATAINVRGTREVLLLAKECRRLRAVTHVSTAFAHTHLKYIEEKCVCAKAVDTCVTARSRRHSLASSSTSRVPRTLMAVATDSFSSNFTVAAAFIITDTWVSVIINAAATVKFDEKLSVATAINVRGTREVLLLAKECRRLRAVTHVSTAFAHTHLKYIEEKFYEPPMSVEALEAVSELNEDMIESILPTLLGKRPNTYCFTKAVAEEAVRKYGEGLPICIVRPAIVVSTYEEPVRGWTDSVYGPTGIVIGIGTGVLRTMYMDLDIVADLVPVDLTVNALLASVWHTAKHYKENQTSDIPIYNFVSGAQNPLKWGDFIELNRKYGIDKPTTKAVWYYGLNPTSNYYLFLFYNFFLHYLPALFIDTYCLLTGRRRAMLKLYGRVMRLARTLFYFSTQDWRFSDARVRRAWAALPPADRALFPFSLADMSWDRLCETFLLGLRVYVIKDDLSTLPEARKKWNRLFYMHQILKAVTAALLINLAYVLLRPIYLAIFG